MEGSAVWLAMGSRSRLLYVTADIGSGSERTSTSDILKWVKEQSQALQISGTAGAYIYRATDTAESISENPLWLVMWEFNDPGFSPAEYAKTLEIPRPASLHRRDVFALQSTYSVQSFSSANLHNNGATNLIVAVVIMLDAALQPEYDRYYETEHIGALMKVPGWRRTRRYVELNDGNEAGQNGEVKILQLHDYDPKNYGVGGTEFKQATGTGWYKDMMDRAVKKKDRRTYEFVGSVVV